MIYIICVHEIREVTAEVARHDPTLNPPTHTRICQRYSSCAFVSTMYLAVFILSHTVLGLLVGTENIATVRNYIADRLRTLYRHMEEDSFVDTTPMGPIISPMLSRRRILRLHAV